MNALPLFPAHIVDICGSGIAIFLSFLALRYSHTLVRLQPKNFIWGFLFYFCVAMAAFSLSRGGGHIVRILLVFGDHSTLWKQLSPYSGGFNTMLMISTAAVTIYYHKGLAAYKAIQKEADKLADANIRISAGAKELKKLNTHLEEMVEERTEQLINREKMASVGEMAAGIAHEINTPLGIILGYTQLMMDDHKVGSEAYTNLQVVERQTKASKRIVADLLKFSRQSESKKVALDINQVIQEVLAVTEHSLNIQQVEVVRKFAPDLPQVIGDAEKLRQVMINLFNNAQFAMGEKGGKITISTYRVNGDVALSVIDTGSGIPDEIKSKVFDPFFTTKEVGKGTGLGLSVIYGIIQQHNGTIDITSPVVDPETGATTSGTEFLIQLPGAVDRSKREKEIG